MQPIGSTVSLIILAASTSRQFEFLETQLAFHPNAQRNTFRRRDARLQSRSFACWNQSLRIPDRAGSLEILFTL
jgi:hypothetical protein